MKHEIDNNGREQWLNKNSHFHREDGGPVFINSDGSEYWHLRATMYRDKKPSIIYINGKEE